MNDLGLIDDPFDLGLIDDPFAGYRVRVRTVTPEDYGPLYLLESSGGLRANWRFGGRTPSFDEYVRSLWSDVLTQELVVDLASDQPIGMVSLYGADFVNGHVRIAVTNFERDRLSRLVWEGVILRLDRCFYTWPFRKVYAESLDDSYAKIASGAARNLFIVEGRLGSHQYADGVYLDLLTLALYRERWMEVRSRYLRFVRPSHGEDGGRAESARGVQDVHANL